MKELWLDVETTGTDPIRHGIIQIAMIAVVDGEEHEFERKISIFTQDEIDPEALRANGTDPQILPTYTRPRRVHEELLEWLGRYVDKYDRNDKFTPGGYNADRFDLPFLQSWFKKCHDKWFGSWMNYMVIDPYAIAKFMRWTGRLDLPNYQLATVCAAFDIPLGDDAHDALADVRATRMLAERMKEELICPVE